MIVNNKSYPNDNDETLIPNANKMKIDNSKSRFAVERKSKEEFEKQADSVFVKNKERQVRGAELVTQYWEFMKDSTLSSEKNPILKSLEKEIFAKLTNFVIELDNDTADSQYGSGSVALIGLLLKSIFYLRDSANEFEYNATKDIESLSQKLKVVDDLEKRLSKLENK